MIKKYKIIMFAIVMLLSLFDTLITVPALLLGAEEQNPLFHEYYPTFGMLSLLIIDFRNLLIFGSIFFIADTTHHFLLKVLKKDKRTYDLSKFVLYSCLVALIGLFLYVPVFANNLRVIYQLLIRL